MFYASEFVYVYDHSDTEEVDLDESDSAENSSAAVLLPTRLPESTHSLPGSKSRSKSGFRSSFRNLFRRKSSKKSSLKPSQTTDESDGAHTSTQECDSSGTPSVDSKKKKNRIRQADPNIVAFKFRKLVDPSHMHTGDPEACGDCGAFLSNLSELRDAAGEGKVWQCEFCDKENLLVHFSEKQKPNGEDVTYMIEPATTVQGAKTLGYDESIVVFCIDVSGSMAATIEVPHAGYISRLKGVQTAIEQQLSKLAQEYPLRRVCLVTFESSVQVLGDCSAEPRLLTSSYTDHEAVMAEAKRMNALRPVNISVDSIRARVRQLRTLGSTALGPGLAAALSIAMQTSGSQVIMCTDGLANVGVGSLEGSEQVRAAEVFYGEMKDVAKEHGVSISVISIEGSDCRLGQLGILADATGGQVNIVDPLQLRDEFGTILDKRILATKVRATLYLHRGLYVRHEPTVVSVATRDVGAVTGDQEITFEYGVRRGQTNASGAEADAEASGGDPQEPEQKSEDRDSKVRNPVDDLEFVPFQLQLRYTASDGSKAVRVFTQRRRLTRDRAEAEKSVNVRVVATHAVQQTARLAEQGRYRSSHAYNVGMSRKMSSWRSGDDYDDSQVQSAYEACSSDLVRNVRLEARRHPSGKKQSTSHASSSLATASDQTANAVYRAKKKSLF